ncbi:MAG: restriction endonuclease subunit S, partial [Burkholderiaceae bacterium]|nr:restriction endonuclease subunit S [Burkholderiaceae bacterium]
QAIISHAVTKGLNPSVPMKDSGIEWLGDVPAHWEVFPVKRALKFLTSGSRGWADHYADQGALFIRIGNLTRDDTTLDLSDIQRVEVPAGAEGQRTSVLPGDVLFSITAYLGSVAVVPDGLETAYVSQHVALTRLDQKRLLPNWAAFVAKSVIGKTYLETQGYGGTKIQLSLDDIANIPMTVPPLAEQQSIVEFVMCETAKLDALTSDAKSAMQILRERRDALISAAVTGKIDVCAHAPVHATEVAA